MRATADRALGALLPLALLLLPGSARAQLMASEKASVSQTVDGTTLTVEYSRPRARGRTGLFGAEVAWDLVWTPGANTATTLAVSKDVTIDGLTVPKGKYSVWMVTRRDAPWELVLDPDTTLFHMAHPKPRPEQLRTPIRARATGPFTETLTWWVPEVRATGLALAMAWDTVRVTLDVRVTPTYRTQVDAATARGLVGRYRVKWEPPPPPSDSTQPPMPAFPDMTLDLRHEGGELRATLDPPFMNAEYYRHWMLLPKGGGLYQFGLVFRGELAELMPGESVEFELRNGRAVRFEHRGANDQLWAVGTRIE